MICKVKSTIEKYSMLSCGETVAVGVSGGADSMCLLDILSKIRDEYGIFLKVIHINHCIRGAEADCDEEFVKDFCAGRGIEFVSFHVDVPSLSKKLKISEEECGRNVRYEYFSSLGTEKIATAHTLSDSAETTLFNLARGTGTRGLCGISPKRGNIIRPLIECSRQEIEAYCKENEISFVTDSTNLSDEYTRNKIRHAVVPVLKGVNCAFEKNVGRLSQAAALQQDFIALCAKDALNSAKIDVNTYDRKELLKSHNAVLKEAVYQMISCAMTKDTEAKHIDLCLNIIKGGCGALEISKDVYFSADSSFVKLGKKSRSEKAQDFETPFHFGTVVTPYNTYKTVLSDTNEKDIFCCVSLDGIDTEKLVFRSRKSADTFCDIRRKNTKTLKKLYCEKKLTPFQRTSNAVLALDGEVLWAERFGTNSKFVVNEKTKKILKIIIGG